MQGFFNVLRLHRGEAHKQTTYRELAEVVGRRFCMSPSFVEVVLRDLAGDPIEAFCILADKGDGQALEFLLNRADGVDIQWWEAL